MTWMAMANKDDTKAKTSAAPARQPPRDARLAAALRENLRRRKAQLRDRQRATDSDEGRTR